MLSDKKHLLLSKNVLAASETSSSESSSIRSRGTRRREALLLRLTPFFCDADNDFSDLVKQMYVSCLQPASVKNEVSRQVFGRLVAEKMSENTSAEWALYLKYTTFDFCVNPKTFIVSFDNGQFEAQMPLFTQFGMHFYENYKIEPEHWFSLFLLQNFCSAELRTFFVGMNIDRKWVKMLRLQTEKTRKDFFDALKSVQFTSEEDLINEWSILLKHAHFWTDAFLFGDTEKRQKLLARISVAHKNSRKVYCTAAPTHQNLYAMSTEQAYEIPKNALEMSIPDKLRSLTTQLKKELPKDERKSSTVIKKFREDARFPAYVSDDQVRAQWWLTYLSLNASELAIHFRRQFIGAVSDASMLAEASQQRAETYKKFSPNTLEQDMQQVNDEKWHYLLRAFDVFDGDEDFQKKVFEADEIGSAPILEFYETMKEVLPKRMQNWTPEEQIKRYLTVAMASEMAARDTQKTKKQEVRAYWTQRWSFAWDLKPHVAEAIDEYVRSHGHIPFVTKQFLFSIMRNDA